MRIGDLGQSLALEAPVGDLAGEREHLVGLGMGLLQALGGGQDLAPPLVDLGQPGTGDRGHAPGRLDRLGVQVEGRRVGVRVLGPVARMDQVVEGLVPVLPVGEMVRQLLVVLGEPIGVELLDARSRPPGAAPAAAR